MNTSETNLIFEAYSKSKTLSEEFEEDESVGDSSNFEDKAEKADAHMEKVASIFLELWAKTMEPTEKP